MAHCTFPTTLPRWWKGTVIKTWITRSCSSLSFHNTTSNTTSVYWPYLSCSSVAIYIRSPHQNQPNYLKTKLTTRKGKVKIFDSDSIVRSASNPHTVSWQLTILDSSSFDRVRTWLKPNQTPQSPHTMPKTEVSLHEIPKFSIKPPPPEVTLNKRHC